jgi:hypothetical protein
MYFKSEKKAKIRMGATRRSLQAQPNINKKNIKTPNLPIRTKIFQKKVYLVPKKEEEPKMRMGATRRNLQVQPKLLKE